MQARISDLVEIAAGTQATCGRKADGSLWCWGRILGESESTLRSPPEQISILAGDLRQLDMASSTGFALKTDGSIWSFSKLNSQQLVAGGAEQFSVQSFSPVCFVQSGGGLACQGDNDNGMLGNGTTTDSTTPVQALLAATTQQVWSGAGGTMSISSWAGPPTRPAPPSSAPRRAAPRR